MNNASTNSTSTQTTSTVLPRLSDYLREDGADARSLMAAIDDLEGIAALATLENELRMPSPCAAVMLCELDVLMAIYEAVGFSLLFACAHDYHGRDIVAAWHYHGARTVDFLRAMFHEHAAQHQDSSGRSFPETIGAEKAASFVSVETPLI